MASPAFSKAIYEGLIHSGFATSEIAAMAGVPESQIELVGRGTAAFSYDQVLSIESATGRTGGQWSIAAEKDVDRGLAELFDEWAGVRFPEPVSANATSASTEKPSSITHS